MKSFFEGWYFKHTAKDCLIAFIASYNVDKLGKRSCYLQVITNSFSHCIEYDIGTFFYDKKNFLVKIGKSTFSLEKARIDIDEPDLQILGNIEYKNITPLKSDIMGPLRHLPFLECRHGILSMHHKLSGLLCINGIDNNFDGGDGYIEKDSGSSFPQKYGWTNYSKDELAITVGVAKIPYLGLKLCGFFAAIILDKKEYRLASYSFGKIESFEPNRLIFSQGKYRLECHLVKANPFELKAPSNGDMTRIIKESPFCTCRYVFYEENKILFDRICENAGYEFSEI